jgi:hypothetical protein
VIIIILTPGQVLLGGSYKDSWNEWRMWHTWEKISAYKVFVGTHERKKWLSRHRCRWRINIKMVLD